MNKNERYILNTELLRTFETIAELGNLTLAAEHLHRTQSAISVQVRKLETDLGVELFDRKPRGMILTDAGEKLLPKARSILSELRQTTELFETPLMGSIRVGIPDDFNDSTLEHILSEFSRSHPGVDVIATSGCTSGFPEAIQKNEIDIAVASNPENNEGIPFYMEKTVWAIKRDTRIEDKKTIPLAILDRKCWWRNAPVEALESAGREYRIVFRSGSFASIKSAIRAGLAVGILPASSVCEKMSVLSKRDGFPKIPASHRSILIGSKVPDELSSAMIEAIRSSRLEL